MIPACRDVTRARAAGLVRPLLGALLSIAIALSPALPAKAQAPAQRAENERPPGASPIPKRRGQGLVLAGTCTLLGSYLFSVLVGLRIDAAKDELDPEDCTRCHIASRFYIPVAGPWLALPDAAPGGGRAVSAVMGLAQVAGVALLATGIGLMIKTRPPRGPNYGALAALGLSLQPLPQGGLLSVRGSGF